MRSRFRNSVLSGETVALDLFNLVSLDLDITSTVVENLVVGMIGVNVDVGELGEEGRKLDVGAVESAVVPQLDVVIIEAPDGM